MQSNQVLVTQPIDIAPYLQRFSLFSEGIPTIRIEQPMLDGQLVIERINAEAEAMRRSIAEQLAPTLPASTAQEILERAWRYYSSRTPVSNATLPKPTEHTRNETRLVSVMNALKAYQSEEELIKLEQEVEKNVEGLRCIISLDLPDTPIFLEGEPHQIYEKSNLVTWIGANQTHPISRIPLQNPKFVHDIGTSEAIESFLKGLEEKLAAFTQPHESMRPR